MNTHSIGTPARHSSARSPRRRLYAAAKRHLVPVLWDSAHWMIPPLLWTAVGVAALLFGAWCAR